MHELIVYPRQFLLEILTAAGFKSYYIVISIATTSCICMTMSLLVE